MQCAPPRHTSEAGTTAIRYLDKTCETVQGNADTRRGGESPEDQTLQRESTARLRQRLWVCSSKKQPVTPWTTLASAPPMPYAIAGRPHPRAPTEIFLARILSARQGFRPTGRASISSGRQPELGTSPPCDAAAPRRAQRQSSVAAVSVWCKRLDGEIDTLVGMRRDNNKEIVHQAWWQPHSTAAYLPGHT